MVWLRAIPKGSWTTPLDFNLHTTLLGEPRIPFRHYVQLVPTQSSPSFLFCQLPAELQLRILYLCDSPALFQLMHTSSATRIEAKKLFWSHPNAWYCVDGNWLRAGGYPGDAHSDTDFMTYVKQLDVVFEWMNPPDWMKNQHWAEWDDKGNKIFAEVASAGFQDMEEQIRDFWQGLQHRFPCVTHVIVSETRALNASLPLKELLNVIARLCPDSIRVSASLLEGDGSYNSRLQRSLWQRVEGEFNMAGEWRKSYPILAPRVLLPHKRFRGPVGAYQCAIFNWRRRCLQITATQVLLINAIERYHFHEQHKSFSCFVPNCKAWFKQPEEYTLHAIQTSHHENENAFPPDHFRALFDQNAKRLERLQDEGFRAWDLIKEQYSSEKRHNTEQAFLHQLKHDPLYAVQKPADQSELWAGIQIYLESVGL